MHIIKNNELVIPDMRVFSLDNNLFRNLQIALRNSSLKVQILFVTKSCEILQRPRTFNKNLINISSVFNLNDMHVHNGIA